MTEHIALYLPSDPPDKNWLMSYPEVSGVQITQWHRESPAQYKLKFFDMMLTMNVMPANEVYEHLAEFSNYVNSLHLRHKSDSTASVLERIAKTKTVLGCIIEPGFDTNGLMGGLLTSIVAKYDGLMFARDCIFGSDGNPVIQVATALKGSASQ